MPPGLIKRIDNYLEMDPQFNDRTSFIIESVRFYLDYRIKLKAQEEAIASGIPVSDETKIEDSAGRT
jgi:hypothetical protein